LFENDFRAAGILPKTGDALTDKNEDPTVAAVMAARWPEGPIDYRILGQTIWSAWNALDNAFTDLLCADVWQLLQAIAHFMLMLREPTICPKLSQAPSGRGLGSRARKPRTQQSEIPTTFWLTKKTSS
jgi:hypothetical protein